MLACWIKLCYPACMYMLLDGKYKSSIATYSCKLGSYKYRGLLQLCSVYFNITAVLLITTMRNNNDKAFIVLVYASLFCSLLCVEFIDEQRVREIEEVINNYTFYPPLDNNETDGRTPIVFGLIVSFGGSFNSSGAVPGVRVALDQINNSTDLLPGYSLHYALSDSQVLELNFNWIYGCISCKQNRMLL